MTKTCFILDELYPADRGGIARLMHNIICQAKAENPALDLHVVLARKRGSAELESYFADIASLHYFQPDIRIAERMGLADLRPQALLGKMVEPTQRALRVLDAVLQASAACGGFDHIEIPDHLGLGAMILQARRAGLAFANTEITCRLHSSLSAIIEAEPFYHPRSDWLAPRLEMERYSLEHADRVIAHLPCIADFNQQHFGFDAAWKSRVEVAFPPVIWPRPEASQPSKGKDFIFTARFQPFKRPMLFIKAAITLLDGGSDYSGNFRMISYGFDADYIDSLRLAVPTRYKDRITIETNVSAKDRLAAMASGIIVQPSRFESLCALAYEAEAAARPLLLARDCLAFGDNPHWRDGENCLMFDPGPQALAQTMETARQWQPKPRPAPPAAPPYFAAPVAKPPNASKAGVAILVGPVEDMESLAEIGKRLAPLLKFTQGIQTFGSKDLPDASDILPYHRLNEADFAGAQWRALAQSLPAEAVILCRPEALPSAQFVQTGAAVVAAGIAYSSQSRMEDTQKLLIYPGKFPTLNAMEPRLCPPCLMLDKADLALIDPLDERDLLARLILRLGGAGQELRLSPMPYIRETGPLPAPPGRRALGYEAAPWQAGLRRIGIEPKSSRQDPLLSPLPLALRLEGAVDLILTKAEPCGIDTHHAQAFTLNPDADMTRAILALTAYNESAESEIEVSLHQANPEPALKAHKEGRGLRRLKAGQSYTMRWGPLWRAAHLTLVVSSSIPAKLRLEAPILTRNPE